MVDMEDKMKCMEAMDFMKDWDTYRATMREAIAEARKLGVSEDQIEIISNQIADFLAEKVCPATPEEELLRDMWNVANPDERKVLTTIFFKMLEQ
jgi:sulfur relay (sulfurtransferase) DsrC/TusE family protein